MSKKPSIELFINLICPFAQRTRIALIHSGYEFKETDVDFKNKPKELLEANPLGKVPTIIYNGSVIYESMVCNEFVEDELLAGTDKSLMPKNTLEKSHIRTSMFLFDEIVGLFYKLLSSADDRLTVKQKVIEKMHFFVKHALSKSYGKGPYFNGDKLSLADLHIYPFLERYDVVAKHYVKFDFTVIPGLELLAEYYNNLKNHESFIKSTLSYPDQEYKRDEYLIKGYTSYYKE